MEQPDIVFSVEQLRCGQSEPCKPEPTPDDCGTADICDSDPDHPVTSSQGEEVDSNPSSPADLFFKLREEPEELLQLAPEAGDIVPLSGEMVQRPKVRHLLSDLFTSLPKVAGSQIISLKAP